MKTTQEIKPLKPENTVQNIVKDKRRHLIPFKPGQTGNPNGRPKGQRNYETIYKAALIKLAELNGKEPDELETEMLSKAIGLARGGNYSFYKDTMDRLYGQATAKTELKTDQKQIININFFANPEIKELTNKLDQAVITAIRNENQEPATTLQDE